MLEAECRREHSKAANVQGSPGRSDVVADLPIEGGMFSVMMSACFEVGIEQPNRKRADWVIAMW